MEVTLHELKSLIQLQEDYSFMEGKKWFIRTVTYHMVGECISMPGSLLKFQNASWVADSGRFMNAIKEGTLNEVEPVGMMYVNPDSIVDMFPWNHELPTEQK